MQRSAIEMKWFTYPQVKEALSPSIAYWLFEVKQLGKALCLLDSSFELHLHKQRFTTLPSEDKQLLNTTDTQGIERIISHHLGHQEVVFGRTIIPNQTYQKFRGVFDNLGDRSIGDVFLHQRQDLVRSEFMVALLDAEIVETQLDYMVNQPVWVRSSVFSCPEGCTLMIQEYFVDITTLLKLQS